MFLLGGIAMQRFVVLVFSAIFAAGVAASASPALARTKAGITPLSVCSSKGEWDKLNRTLQTRAHAYHTEFLGRIDKSNPNRQDKNAAARSALAGTKKGQPVDVNCRPLPGGSSRRRCRRLFRLHVRSRAEVEILRLDPQALFHRLLRRHFRSEGLAPQPAAGTSLSLSMKDGHNRFRPVGDLCHSQRRDDGFKCPVLAVA